MRSDVTLRISFGVSQSINVDDTVRPFRCTLSTCSKAFTRSDLLKRHEILHQSRERTVLPPRVSHEVNTPNAAGTQPSGISQVEDDWLPTQIHIDSDLALASSSRGPERSKRKNAEDSVVSIESMVSDDREFKRVSRARNVNRALHSFHSSGCPIDSSET